MYGPHMRETRSFLGERREKEKKQEEEEEEEQHGGEKEEEKVEEAPRSKLNYIVFCVHEFYFIIACLAPWIENAGADGAQERDLEYTAIRASASHDTSDFPFVQIFLFV